MKLKKEPKHVDFVIKSETWSEKDLADFRALMLKLKKPNITRDGIKKNEPIVAKSRVR
jgi:hypothetical protein